MTKQIARISQYNNIVTHHYTDGTTKEISIVTIPERIQYLEEQHQRLHKEVAELEKKNDPSIRDRKKEKLMLKDEIERLTAQYESDSGVEYFR